MMEDKEKEEVVKGQLHFVFFCKSAHLELTADIFVFLRIFS